MINHHALHPAYGFIGLVTFIVFAYLAQRRIDLWRDQVGYAPPPPTTKKGNAAYKQQLWRDFPKPLLKQVRLLQGTGFALAVLGIFLAQ